MNNYLFLFLLFFKIGSISFGGGLAMIPAIFQSVEEYNLISIQEFTDMVALSQATPGPVFMNLATYIGVNVGGFFGALVSTLAVAIPSFLVVIIVLYISKKIKKGRIVEDFLAGIKPATLGLIISSTVLIAREIHLSVIMVPIVAISFFLSFKMKMSPILLMSIMAIFGSIFFR